MHKRLKYLLSQWAMLLLQNCLAFTPRTGIFHSLWLNLFKNIAWEELHVSIVVDADVGLWVHVKWYSKGSPFWYTLHTPFKFAFPNKFTFQTLHHIQMSFFVVHVCNNTVKSKEPLSFAMRLKISLGSSKGIVYLHTEVDPPIFHWEIKANNIL